MGVARFFTEDEHGNTVLLSTYDFDTKKLTIHVSEDEYEAQRCKNMERIQRAADDIAKQDPFAFDGV